MLEEAKSTKFEEYCQVPHEVKFADYAGWIDRLGVLKQYFMRGHHHWFTLMLSLGSFILLVYNFVIIELDFLPAIFRDFLIFVVGFSLFYFIINVVVGYFDYRRGTFFAQEYLLGKHSPIWQGAFRQFEVINAKIDKIAEVMNIDLSEEPSDKL